MKDGYRNRCKDCHNTYVREVWYKKNAKIQKAASAEWKARNQAKVLATRYKCEVDIIQSLLDYGRCQICDSVDNLHIDHCHDSGKIRGILCRGCNHGLGNFSDSRDKLLNAARYLEVK